MKLCHLSTNAAADILLGSAFWDGPLGSTLNAKQAARSSPWTPAAGLSANAFVTVF